MKKIFLFLGLFNMLVASPARAATCTVDSARWSVGSVTTGQTIKAVVGGHDCGGSTPYTVKINVYERDIGMAADHLQELVGRFNSQGTLAEVNVSLTSEDYKNGGNESGSESIYFDASANSTNKTSATITFTNVAPANTTNPSGGNTGTGGGTQATETTYQLDIQSPAQFEDLVDLVNKISTWIFNISIPIAVALIIYAGVRFLLSRGVPAEVTKARQILTYAIVGLAIVLIGKGFVTLVTSIVGMGSGGTSTQSQNQVPTGSSCITDADCGQGQACFRVSTSTGTRSECRPSGTQTQTNTPSSGLCNPACPAGQSCVRVSQSGSNTVQWLCR